jgi:hypothetical protein
MKTKSDISFILEKSEIEDIISSSQEIPENELHVLEGSTYEQALRSFDMSLSLGLLAIPMEKLGAQNYCIGFIKEIKIQYVKNQATPLAVNHKLVEREKKEFRENKLYTNYELCIITPPITVGEFISSKGSMSPVATPDRLYEG